MSLTTKALAGLALLVVGAAAVVKRAARRPHAPIDDVTPEIVLDDDYDVTFWMRRFGVTKRQLKLAVKRVGPVVDDVRAHFAARA